MPLLTTKGVSPSLHTWREYDCFMLQMLENIQFPATRMPCSYTGSLNFTLLVLQSSKSWVKSKLKEMARRLHDHWLIGLSTVNFSIDSRFLNFVPTWWRCGGCVTFQWRIDASHKAPGPQYLFVLQRWGGKRKMACQAWGDNWQSWESCQAL